MSKASLTKQIKEYFAEQDHHAKVGVIFDSNATCSVSLQRSGRGLGGLVSFKNLNWLSKLLKTDDIDIRDEHQQDGCETCDHGASTEATIVCKNISYDYESHL